MWSFCIAKASHIFSTKNFIVFGYKVVKHLTSWPLNEVVKLTMLWTTGPWPCYQHGIWIWFFFVCRFKCFVTQCDSVGKHVSAVLYLNINVPCLMMNKMVCYQIFCHVSVYRLDIHFWVLCKQHRPISDSIKYGIWSVSTQFAYRNFCAKYNKVTRNKKKQQEMDSSRWYGWTSLWVKKKLKDYTPK